MKDIIKLIKYTDISYMKRQIGCMIFLLLNTVLTLVYPSCISVIVDQGVAKGSIEDIIKYSILMFVLGILINEKVDEIKEQKGPCLWCDATDTCADLGCVFCDGLADDFVG